MTKLSKLAIAEPKTLGLTSNQWKRWGRNLLFFSAPALAVFFGQLSTGVNWKVAGAVAVLALYGALSDLLKKINESK